MHSSASISRILVAALLLCISATAHAANPYLVKDINAVAAAGSSSPSNSVIYNSRLYFSATTPENGTELWVSDGTSSGTILVKDINPGSGSSNPANLTVVGTTLFFTADDGTNGSELWKTNGTAAGTIMVREISAVPGFGSSPSNLIAMGTTLYFLASDSLGTELWMSDGSSKGTVMVADINPGANSSSPSYLTVMGTYLYFRANDGTNGYALWRTNGTTTRIISGTENSYPAFLTVLGSYIYFQAYDSKFGYELWRSNGSTATQLDDINPGTASSSPTNLTVMGSYLYFQANDGTNGYALWRTNGTTPAMVTGSANTSPSNLTAMGTSYLYFQGYDATNGYELWRTDGTTASRFSDINAGAGNSSPVYLTVMGSYLYFRAYDATNGSALWRTNGTTTVLVTGTANSSPSDLTVMGSYLYFQGYDSVNGYELWRSDGSATSLVSNMGPDGTASSSPSGFVSLGGYLYFAANDGVNGTELWRTNGTTAATTMVANINSGSGSSSPSYLTVMGSYVYFQAYDTVNGYSLWRSNGTTTGMVTGSTGTQPSNLEVVGSYLYFQGCDVTNGCELWRTDGTTAALVRDIYPGTASSSPSNLTAVGTNDLFYSANDGSNGIELWRSVVSSNSAAMVKDINPTAGASSSPTNLYAIGLVLYFRASDGTNGYELWKSNGTSPGTTMVANIYAGSGSGVPSSAYMATMGGYLYFRAYDPTNGNSLWKSNGTTTTLVSGSAGSSPSNPFVFGSNLYYQGYNGANGYELWKTDGTNAAQLCDIYPGSGGSYPSNFVALGSYLYFRASDGLRGYELWKTDGTAAGTSLAADTLVGVSSGLTSTPFAALGTLLLLSSSDPQYGTELFAFDTGYPTGTITANGGAGYVDSTSITLNLSCTDSGGSCSQMQFSTDNLSWTTAEAYATTKAWTLASGDGPKLIYVRYSDNSGNWSNPYLIRIVLDTSTPQTILSYYPPAATTSKTTTFHFTSPETATFECWLDENSTGYQPCTSPWTGTLYGGTHIFKVRAVDPAGHVDPTPASYEWMILDDIGQTAFGWGKNTFGQLGNGESGTLSNEVISQVKGAMGFIAIATGGTHSAAVRNDGTVWTWGSNVNGQLGHGYPSNSALPQQIADLKDVVAIAAGTAFTLAAKSDGSVWFWGKHPASGTIVTTPQQVVGLSSITAVSAGDHHALALASNGTVWAWGTDINGELGQNSYNFIQSTPLQVRDSVGIMTGVSAISAGKDHSLAIRKNASNRSVVMTWGYNSSAQLGFYPGSPGTDSRLVVATELATPSGMCDAISIAAGETHSAFAYTSTTTVCGDSIPYAYTAGAYGDGELATGNPNPNSCNTPCQVAGVANVLKVAASKNNTYFLTDNDVVWAAGNNQYGQLGSGLHDNLNHYTPTMVGYLSGAEDIAAGSGFALSLKTAWNTGVADSTPNSGRYTSLAVDGNDKVHISYSSNGYPAYTTNSGGDWAATVIDPVYETGSTAITLDGSNNPHVCSLSWNGSNVVIRYITKSGGVWQAPVTVANLTDNPGIAVSSHCDIGVYGSNVYIAYIDASTPSTNPTWRGIVRLAYRSGTTWTIYTVDDPGVMNKYAGTYLSMTVDSSGYAHMTYKYDRGEFRYAKVLPGSTPTIAMIDYGSFSDTHITLDSNGKAHVAYCGLGSYWSGLRYATNASGSWVHSTINEDAAADLCEPGYLTSIAFRRGDSSAPYISYYDVINEDLKVAYLKNGKWIKSGVDTDGTVGKYSSIGVDSLGKVHVSYYDDTEPNYNLKYASNSDFVRPTGSIAINGGATYTTSTDAILTLSCNDGIGGIGCWQMKFSLDSGATWSFPEPFATTKTITLPAGNGPKAVQVRFEDSANNWSLVYSRTITLDTTAATGSVAINGNPVPDQTKNSLVLLTLSASDINGVTEMSLSNDGSTWYNFPYSTSFGWSLSPGDGSKVVLARFKDSAGNWSDPASDSILLDTTAPVSNASPGGGIRDTAVSVTLSCSDGSGSGCASTYYTTDGTVPTLSSTRYTGTPITVSGLTSPVYLKFFSVDALGNAESPKTETYTFVAGYTTLTLDLASPTLLQNGLLDVSGKLTRYPDSEAVPNNGMDLSGLPVALTVTGPAGSPCEAGCVENTTIYSSLGHYRFQGLDRFSFKGTYTLQAGFAGTGLHQASQSGSEALLVGASAGYAIIVEGKVSSEEGLESHNKTTGRVYEALKERGFVDDNIMYFNYAGTVVPGVDAVPAKGAIQAAIGTWAAERMNGAPAPLYVIFVDHGNQNTFYIDPSTITPAELNGWLGSMETALSASARLEKRVVILGACYSGSFLDTLKQAAVPGVDAGRIVISSAAADEQSYKGPNEPDGIRSGEFFIEELFKQLRKGSSFKAAFVEAAALTRTFTSQGSDTGSSANGYGDTSVQHPLLDDDGNGIGSNTLVDGMGDGIEADLLHLGFGVTNASLGPADIKAVSATHYLGSGTVSTPTPLWLEPYSNGAVSSGWFEVKAPTTLLSGTGGSGQLALDIPRVLMELKVSGRWEPVAGADPVFTTAGKYEVYYFTKSTNAEISEMKRSLVYKNYAGNGLPAAFDLVSPGAGGLTEKTRTELNLVWNASDDPDGLTYTVQVATDSGFTNIVHQKEEIGTTWYYVDESAALGDKAVFYWRVLAVDTYGALRPSNQVWSFETDNTNALPGQIRGYVYDGLSSPVTGATVTAMLGAGTVAQTSSGAGGAFVFVVPPGTYTLNATATGYTGGSSGPISLASGGVQNTSVTIIITNPALQVTVSGSGCGTVTSAPAGISCISGSPANCSAPYPNGTPVTMTASPDWKSLFGGWGNAYTGMTNPVEITMNANKTLTAAFTPNLQARVGATGYATLQEAYDNLATVDGSTIMAREYTFLEPGLLFNSSKTVTIDGGWDSGYTLQTGMTTIDGTLTVRQGRLNVRGVVVK